MEIKPLTTSKFAMEFRPRHRDVSNDSSDAVRAYDMFASVAKWMRLRAVRLQGAAVTGRTICRCREGDQLRSDRPVRNGDPDQKAQIGDGLAGTQEACFFGGCQPS